MGDVQRLRRLLVSKDRIGDVLWVRRPRLTLGLIGEYGLIDECGLLLPTEERFKASSVGLPGVNALAEIVSPRPHLVDLLAQAHDALREVVELGLQPGQAGHKAVVREQRLCLEL